MSGNVSACNAQSFEDRTEMLVNREIEQTSSIKRSCYNKKDISVSIILGGLIVGTIAGLALGLIFGPLAGLVGFCCGAVVGGLLGYAFIVMHRNCISASDSENRNTTTKNIRETREILNELSSELGGDKVDRPRTTNENIIETRRILDELSIELDSDRS